MAYKQFVPLPQMNFQFNRVLTYGAEAWHVELFTSGQTRCSFDRRRE